MVAGHTKPSMKQEIQNMWELKKKNNNVGISYGLRLQNSVR